MFSLQIEFLEGVFDKEIADFSRVPIYYLLIFYIYFLIFQSTFSLYFRPQYVPQNKRKTFITFQNHVISDFPGLPLTSTTTSGIPVGIAVARQRSTSSHVAVTNTSTTSYPDLNNMATTQHMGNMATTQHMGNIGQAAGLTANGLHSVATSMATGLHSVAGSMGNGQCLPAMSKLNPQFYSKE